MEILKRLSPAEEQQLVDAIAYITILVAGADHNIDDRELASAGKLIEVRSFSAHTELVPYYQAVEEEFQGRVSQLLDELPSDPAERQVKVGEALTKLNGVLAKLDIHLGHIFYESFKSFAQHVAKASGGVIGMFTIGKEEKKVIDLPMIEPIIG